MYLATNKFIDYIYFLLKEILDSVLSKLSCVIFDFYAVLVEIHLKCPRAY